MPGRPMFLSMCLIAWRRGCPWCSALRALAIGPRATSTTRAVSVQRGRAEARRRRYVARRSGKTARLLSFIRSSGPWHIPHAGNSGANRPDSSRRVIAKRELLCSILLDPPPSRLRQADLSPGLGFGSTAGVLPIISPHEIGKHPKDTVPAAFFVMSTAIFNRLTRAA